MSAFSSRSTTHRSDHQPILSVADRPEPMPAFWRGWLRPVLVERLMIVADILLILICGLFGAAAYHWFAAGGLNRFEVYAAASALVAVNFALLVMVQHGYRIGALASPFRQMRLTFVTWVGLFAGLLAVAFAMKVSENFSRGATISFFMLGLLALSAWKLAAAALIARALRTGAFANSRVVLIAERGLAASSAAVVELRRHGYRPSRIMEISAKDMASPTVMSAIQPQFNALIAYARNHRIEHVFLLFDWNRQHIIDSLLDALKVLPTPVHLIPDASVGRFLKYPTIATGGTWTAELRRAPLTLRERALKRAMDLIGASLALIIFAPVMLGAALLIKCESRGPVLFRQTRNGFNGRAFKIFKFRSMSVTEDGLTIVQATRHDRRVTRVGRWLRRTSIDELPQLLNVLRGEMSLVGPRPHAAAHNTEYEKLIGNYAFRHHVKPGITGWAQVNGYRGETIAVGLMEKRVKHDLWYINNWSVWLDISIVFKTALTNFRQSKAY